MNKKRLLAILATAGVALTGAAAAIIPMTGASAADCAAAWSSGAVYNSGNTASHGGRNWRAQWWTQGETPGTTGEWGVWRDQGGCSGGGGGGTNPPPVNNPPAGGNNENYQPGKLYRAGAVVRYNGQCYVAEHENPGYDPVISHWYWNPTTCSGGGGGNNNPPVNPGRFPVTEAQFNQMFPGRSSFYTYAGLVAATQKYSAFASGGRGPLEAVAFLANIAHESGGLVHVREINRGNYCDLSQSYGCPAGQGEYYGRGPIQLSWNFNYRAAGHALGMGDDLLRNPDKVASDPSIAFQTAIWYWMTQSGPGSKPAHNAIQAGDFNGTVRAINGSLECNGRNRAQVQSRIANLENFATIAGVNLSGVARSENC